MKAHRGNATRDFDDPLFDRPVRVPARATDPVTSVKAATELLADGTVKAQAAATHAVLIEWVNLWGSNPTSAELGGTNQALRYMYARRLPDLVEMGLVERAEKRRCNRTGKQALTWRPKEGI